jgi:DNA sulfur modification protein DndE
MFTHIRTSKANKEVVSQLTRKLNLGAENVIARIALAYSLKSNEKLDLKNIQDSGGKEYSRKVLFGNYDKYYLALMAHHYQLHISNQDIGKYVKLHVDVGLEIINKEVELKSNIDGFNFLSGKN